MATQESYEDRLPDHRPGAMDDVSAETAEIIQLHPSQIEEGVLNQDQDYVLPIYTTEFDESKTTDEKPIPQDEYGIAYPQTWHVNDEAETKYKVVRYEASDPRSNMWVVKDTAWGTQPEGLNTDVARKLMSLGFNVLIKGPEINSSLPLSQSAYHTHKLLDALSMLGYLESRFVTVEGYSRGSMIGFGTNAYAPLFDRKVLYSNLTDPCLARPIKLLPPDIETVKKAVTLPWDISLLGASVLKGLADPRRGHHLARTVDISLEGAKQFVRTGKPLMNGEAGQMAGETPIDMQAIVAFFRLCRVNDAAVYRQKLAGRPGVRFVRPIDGHGGAIDKRIIGNVSLPFSRLGQQLIEGRTPDELDYRHIIHGIKTAA
ncbi:MAG: hypothetical protein JWO35_302 [Candidatus Saccharibacteria bacterium]|nr:hypothetical protein [Candidatus Saccharibacteria bacterium]